MRDKFQPGGNWQHRDPMQQYHRLFRLVLEEGKFKTDRTGTGTYSIFGAQERFALTDSFPLLTTERMHLRRSPTNFSGFYMATQTFAICARTG